MCLRWSRLGKFVPTVGLPDDSRPGCCPSLCHLHFSGVAIPSFVLPSLEISSSSHLSWRLLILFKLPPLLCAASLELLFFGVVVVSACEFAR